MDVFCEIGFVLGWFGVLCCILSFAFLVFKTQEQIEKIKKNADTEENKQFKIDSFFLLIHAFGCTIFTFIYCIFYGTIGTNPSRLKITITQNICQFTAQYMANAGWQLSRYCFYNFMLWRIRASFREPESVKLSKFAFYIYFTLIHLWLIFVLCITIFWTPRTLTPTGQCGVIVLDIFNGFTTAHIRTIAWALDFILTVCLLFLFLKRLYQLTRQNQKINKYRRKTIILGLTATLTSITMAIVIYVSPTKEWRYFIPADQIINLSAVIFTFKFSFNAMCPHYNNNNNNNNNNINNNNTNNNQFHHQHENIKQESTISAQPNDSEVWNMLVKSQRIHRDDNNAMPNDDQV